MKSMLFNGGLGNQAFQYIFARFVEEFGGEQVLLDDSYFFINPAINGYELEKVFKNSTPRLLSKHLSPSLWSGIVERAKQGYSVPQQLLDSGINLFVVQEAGEISFNGNMVCVEPNGYTPHIAKTQGSVYYDGYWICRYWFDQIKKIMLHELEFPEITSSKNKEYARQINETCSVAVHIRRGDFIDYGWLLDTKHYRVSMEKFSGSIKEGVYFIFSDDLDWCREHTLELGLDLAGDSVVYVEGNADGVNNYVDMQLMSMCKHAIMSNSSFSYLSVILNQNKGMMVANPTNRRV